MTTETTTATYKAIEEWLSAHGVKYTVHFIGDACPPFCEDKNKAGIGTFPRKTHIHGQNYRLEMERESYITGRSNINRLHVDFWNSYRDSELKAIGCKCKGPYAPCFNKAHRAEKITVSDVLGCVDFHVAESLDDFASEFGYDVDSRKAENIYRTIQDQVRDFKRMFTSEELDELAQLKGEL